MQTADFDVASFDNRAQADEDKKLLVKFFVKPRPDKEASKVEGRPVYKDVEYIDIRIPGDRTGGVCRPASFQDKERFKEHYAAFKTRTDVPLDGTPLIEWPLVTRSLAEELAFYNVKTVEHLATMSDTHSGKFMGMNNLKAKALKWLEQAGEEAKVHGLQQELSERDDKLAIQAAQIDELQAQMLKLMGQAEEVPHSSPASTVVPVSEPEIEVEAPKKRARRKRRVKPDGPIQDDK